MAKRRKSDVSDTADGPPPLPQQPDNAQGDVIDRERIASRAYEIYVARGGVHGRDMDDWLEAERELTTAGSKRATGPKNNARGVV
jgi:hypothetical protein